MNVTNIMNGLAREISLPVKQDICTDVNPAWVVYNYADERDTEFADDNATAETVYLQIHLFTPMVNKPEHNGINYANYQSYKRLIKSYLKSNSFFNISSQTFYEDDTKLRHTVFECQLTNNITEWKGVI